MATVIPVDEFITDEWYPGFKPGYTHAPWYIDPVQTFRKEDDRPASAPGARPGLQEVAHAVGQGPAGIPGVAVGTIVFTADDAVEKSKTAPVVLVRKETVPCC